jgi:IS30 family transposase
MPAQKPQKAARRVSAADFVRAARNSLMVRCPVCLSPEVRAELQEVLKEIRQQGRKGISRRMIYQHMVESFPSWSCPSYSSFERHVREHENK